MTSFIMDHSMKFIKITIGIIVLLFISSFFFGAFYSVETGKQAVVSRFKKLIAIEGEGLHFKIPYIDTVDFITVRNSAYKFNMEVSTKDMQTISLNLVAQTTVTDVETLYRKYKTNYSESLIEPRVREIVQSNIAKYTIEEFIDKRQQLSKNIYESIKKDLADDGLAITNVSIINHDFSDKYDKAIEDKKVAEQEVETAKFIQEKARVEAQNKVELARFQLEEKKLQAEANKVESTSLSVELLQKMQIEKWDGKLPQVISGSSDGLIYNLKGIIE